MDLEKSTIHEIREYYSKLWKVPSKALTNVKKKVSFFNGIKSSDQTTIFIRGRIFIGT